MCVLCWRVCVMLACVCYAGVYVVMLACVCCDYVCDLCVCVLCWLVCSYAGVYVLNKLLSTACTLFDVREAMGGNKLYRVHLFLMQGRQRGRQRKQVPFGGTVQRTPKRTVSIPAENGIHPRREPQGTPQRTPRYPAENPKVSIPALSVLQSSTPQRRSVREYLRATLPRVCLYLRVFGVRVCVCIYACSVLASVCLYKTCIRLV